MNRRDLQNFCEEYTPLVAAFFRRNGVAPRAVADLVQECFLVLCRRHGAVLDGKAAPFLHGVARKLLIAHRRKSRNFAAREARFVQYTADSCAAPSADPPDILASQHDQIRHLVAAIERLPARQKEVIRLVYLEGFSRAEAAREMGVTRQTLHAYEQEALGKLKDLLEFGQPSRNT